MSSSVYSKRKVTLYSIILITVAQRTFGFRKKYFFISKRSQLFTIPIVTLNKTQQTQIYINIGTFQNYSVC
uniref:Uncharacterized protein n=1 Tax=Anguilla anguilla TaxID=7936 RepID=A0A0E9VEX6_ANGAN